MTNLILPPDTLLQGRYLIRRLIAQGGMGAVYEAVDQRLGNTVALKHILVGDTRMRKAFEREARLLAALRHPALPAVSDHFTESTNQFLVMQYIPGDDLGTMLDRKRDTFTTPEALPRVLAWADMLLDALDYLHSHQPPIIHRDIKPQNLKLSPRGEPVLLDFGLAKGAINQTHATTTGYSVRGYSTQYAPLEQIQGTGTEPRSDLYALAATLYHLLTGEVPPNALTRAAAVLANQPDPLVPAHKRNPNIPPAVAVILQQAMAHGIAKRFASAAALRTALQAASATPPSSAASPSPDSAGQQTIVVPIASTAGAPAARLAEVAVLTPVGAEEPAPTAPRPAAPAPPSTAPTLIVAHDGTGGYTTINAAIAAAETGSRILVRPGLYRESVVIDRSLELIGDGPLAEVVIEATDHPAIQMQTDNARVRGLTLRGHTTDETRTRATVHIGQGRLALEACNISTDGRVCVIVHSTDANPVLWRCRIHASRGIGVLVYAQGRGTIEECELDGHAQAAIVIRHGGNPTIRRCNIHHSAQDGIYIDERGSGTIEECDIWENVRAGIEIKRGSTPFVRNCTIHHQTDGYGVYVCDGGEGIVEMCDISYNARAGIAVTQGSNPLIRTCAVHHEQQRGVLCSTNARGTFERCHIHDNAQVGVEIRQAANPTLRECTINGHRSIAIWLHQRGAGSIEHCDLRGNARGAWHIEEGCPVVRIDNRE
jgi:pectin methylesterase-like acyl-CoA thioesterase